MRSEKWLLRLYLTVEAGLLICFFLADLQNDWQLSNRLKFCSIAVNSAALLVLTLRQRAGYIRSPRLLAEALGLTVTLFADYWLILKDSHYLLGVLSFCAVETLYALSLQPERASLRYWSLRIGSFLAVLFLLRLIGSLDSVSAAAAYSMVQLSFNVFSAWKMLKSEELFLPKTAKLLALGLSLFWCCDASVGLRNFAMYFPAFPERITAAAGLVIWLFYLPSQVFIFLSFRNEVYHANK